MDRILDVDKYERFKYFLECYFNQSADYAELDKLIHEFNTIENCDIKAQLKNEINKIMLEEDIEAAKEFIRKYGMRNMSPDKLKWFLTCLNSKVNT